MVDLLGRGNFNLFGSGIGPSDLLPGAFRPIPREGVGLMADLPLLVDPRSVGGIPETGFGGFLGDFGGVLGDILGGLFPPGGGGVGPPLVGQLFGPDVTTVREPGTFEGLTGVAANRCPPGTFFKETTGTMRARRDVLVERPGGGIEHYRRQGAPMLTAEDLRAEKRVRKLLGGRTGGRVRRGTRRKRR